MTINQRLTQAISSLSTAVRMALAVAALSLVGVVGTTTATVSAQSNNVPTGKQDCSNWRQYGDMFRNRGDCVSFVEHNTVHGNGYGGGGNGGGNGGLGNVIRQLFSFISHLLATLFAFLGHLF